MSTLAEATSVRALNSHTYSANFLQEWCIGSVPHGGFVTATFLRVAAAHFEGTLAKQNQPHTVALHLEFLRRTQVGTAQFAVKDVKLGRQMSVIHVTLHQDGREEVVGYVTQGNISKEEGMTLPTGFSLHPPPPTVDLARLARGEDRYWEEQEKMPYASFRKVTNKMKYHFPKAGPAMKSLSDEWIRFADGSRFTNESIGLVADLWPMIPDQYRPGENPFDFQQDLRLRREGREVPERQKSAALWFPTVLLNLDVKKALPLEGVEWLFARVRSKVIKNGRFDIEVVIMDEAGDVVALSHHVVMILSAERNMAKRKAPQSESKI